MEFLFFSLCCLAERFSSFVSRLSTEKELRDWNHWFFCTKEGIRADHARSQVKCTSNERPLSGYEIGVHAMFSRNSLFGSETSINDFECVIQLFQLVFKKSAYLWTFIRTLSGKIAFVNIARESIINYYNYYLLESITIIIYYYNYYLL